jgi:hypothetical protein
MHARAVCNITERSGVSVTVPACIGRVGGLKARRLRQLVGAACHFGSSPGLELFGYQKGL